MKNEVEKTAEELAELTFKLLTNCLEKEERLAESHGLTQAEFRCLRMFNANEIINNKTISERMKLSPSRLTRIIDGLVEKGYIFRNVEPNDRRNMRVYLSVQGVDIVNQLNAAYIDVHKQILDNINIDEHASLINAMKTLLVSLEKWISS